MLRTPFVIHGLGEPGVKRGVPKMVSERELLEEAEKSAMKVEERAT
jgi:hypothetical protein